MIFHIARRATWEQAVRDGAYTQSTVDRTLEDEGFIHASDASQVQGVADRYYQDVVEELVLLVIDPDRLEVELRYEAPPGRVERYPHLYGPLRTDAVVDVRPLRRDGAGRLAIEV